MKITIATAAGATAIVEVSPDETVANVKALVEVELGIMLMQQQLFFNGNLLSDDIQLISAGVKDGDLLMVTELSAEPGAVSAPAAAAAPAPTTSAGGAVPASAGAPATATAAAPPLLPANLLPPMALAALPRPVASSEPVPTGLQLEDLPANLPPDRLHAIVRANPPIMRRLEHLNPRMAAAIRDPNPAALRELLMKQSMAGFERQRQRALEAQRLNDNPWDEEAQKKIEEDIRRANVDENYRTAMEHMPETFSAVTMLFVDCKVNGHPLKAFIDSGARMTVMSIKCAERCGIMRLVDTRMAGQAVGVGTAKIVGKVHMAPITIAGLHLNCSFSILEGDNLDFILGLDMLKRYQCVIDLKAHQLKLHAGSESVTAPFLSEAQLRGHVDGMFGPGSPPAPSTASSSAASSSSAAAGAARPQQPPTVPSSSSAAATASGGAGAGAGAGAGGGASLNLPSQLFDAAALTSALSSGAADAKPPASEGTTTTTEGMDGAGVGTDEDGDTAMPSVASPAAPPVPPPVPSSAPAPAASAPAASAPAASAPAAPAPATAGSAGDPRLQRLVEVAGCSVAQAQNALEAADGDEQLAARLLLGL